MAQTSNVKDSGIGKYLVTYVVILAIAALQFVLAYQHIDGSQKFFSMLAIAFVEAAIGVLFFMHLSEENRAMKIFVGIFILFVLAAMQYSWPDSFRSILGAPFSSYH